MIWLAWRQQRAEYLIMGAVLAVLAVFLLITGLDLAHASQQLGLSNCLAHAANRGNCFDFEQAFLNQYAVFFTIVIWLPLLPALLGILVGAPLVARELEQGTHRLVWTQSITRIRWLAVKLALMLIAGLMASGVLMALLIWWYGPIDQFNGHFTAAAFDFAGPVWLAAVLLALALGVFAGTLVRRTVLAMFLTLVLILAVRLPVELLLRPNYEPPIVWTQPLTQEKTFPSLNVNDWQLSSGWLDAQGHQLHNLTCNGPNQTYQQCAQANGAVSTYLTYQPADRFWTFQWIETGIYLVFVVLALGATIYLVKQRLT